MKWEWLRNLVSASGGRKAFYCLYIVTLAAIMLAFERLTGAEFGLLVGGTFTVLGAANAYEAVADSNAKNSPDSINVKTDNIDVNVNGG